MKSYKIGSIEVDRETFKIAEGNPDAVVLAGIFAEGFRLYLEKNKDYRDAWKKHGLFGLVVRIGDKIERLENLAQFGGRKVREEKIRDSALDLANYGMLAVLWIDKYGNGEGNENKS